MILRCISDVRRLSPSADGDQGPHAAASVSPEIRLPFVHGMAQILHRINKVADPVGEPLMNFALAQV
jgi:hypothetical protein